jgi:CBS domain containing-hemolysin-like protein
MHALLELLPWLIAMTLLMAGSGFFSASEAAMFYLRPRIREKMQNGSTGERMAFQLTERPERLLSAILFWNLVINISYFAISSIIAIRLEKTESGSASILFAIASLLAIIFFSEMLPKNVAVLRPQKLASAFSIPLSFAVRVVDPIMPLLRSVNLISRRLIWPGFEAESYMDVADLERAIEHTAENAELIKQEQTVMRNIVTLSSTRVDEWMRPRTQFVTFRPPVSRMDLVKHGLPESGYLLVSEPDSIEISHAIRLDNQYELADEEIERFAEPVQYMPWCATVAEAFECMSQRHREVTVVVNEYGDTVGVLTIEDILEMVFQESPSRARRLLNREPITKIEDSIWLVSGMLSLRRLSKELDVELPQTNSVTIGGVMQDVLQKNSEKGDLCDWGPFAMRVIDFKAKLGLLVELKLQPNAENES